MAEEEVNQEVAAEEPAAEEVVEEEATEEDGSSDIDYIAEIKAEVAKAIADRDEALAELERAKSGSGDSSENKKLTEELKQLLASFKGKDGQVPTGAAASASNNNNAGTAPTTAAERAKKLYDLTPEDFRVSK